jgi:hypothetical protein
VKLPDLSEHYNLPGLYKVPAARRIMALYSVLWLIAVAICRWALDLELTTVGWIVLAGLVLFFIVQGLVDARYGDPHEFD